MNSGKYRRLWCALLAACCLGAGLGAAASGGGGADPASLGYLRDTFLPDLEKGIAARAKEDAKGTYDAALTRLDELGERHVKTDPSGWTTGGTFRPMDLKGGDTLALAEGGSLLWLAGTATGTGLVDATAGAALPADGKLTPGHRYLNGQEGFAAVISIDSDAAQAAPAGRWKIAAGGREVTGFYDLSRTDWFYDGVRWAVGQGWFRGVAPTRFSPYGTVDRATMATLLHRLAGSPAVPFQGLFPDVPRDQWYTEAVEWAAANGIAAGGGDGNFSPARPAGREEIVVMLRRCAGLLGLDTTASAPLDGFLDSAAVSPDAWDAVSWAVGAGILQGADGSLLPKNNITRAQAALILQRFQGWRDG